MSPTSVSDSHPAVLSLRTAALVTSAAGFISLAWSITHHKDISDDGAGGINSIVLGTIAYAFLWSLVALTIRLTPRRIHPGIYLAFDLIAFLANVIAGSIGLAVLAPAMEGGYNCYSAGCDGDAVLRVEIFASRARKRGIPSPARNKREHSLDNQDPPRDCQNGNTLLGDLRGLVEGLLVFLEFYRAGGCEGHACDDEHVVGEDGDPFHFFVEGLNVIVSADHVRIDGIFRSADDAQGAEEEEEEPSQKTIASMSYGEVEDWDGEDCVDGAGSGREGVGHCASRFRQMYILRAIYLAEESAKSGRQRQWKQYIRRTVRAVIHTVHPL
ncbi:hypothetical protein KXV92_002873 [Aspergillus fumigatus]|nr:hypothetical protein KXV92_002873 [Aspergillus fumigatus]